MGKAGFMAAVLAAAGVIFALDYLSETTQEQVTYDYANTGLGARAALEPETFDADVALGMIEDAELAERVKLRLAASVHSVAAGHKEPGPVLDQLREVLFVE